MAPPLTIPFLKPPFHGALAEQTFEQRMHKLASMASEGRQWAWKEVHASLVPPEHGPRGSKAAVEREQERVRAAAEAAGLLPTSAPVDRDTKFADFTGYVLLEVQLPRSNDKHDDLWAASDPVQFAVLDKMIGGTRPPGYTWHHHQDEGKMQLVLLAKHNVTTHNGGREGAEDGSVPRWAGKRSEARAAAAERRSSETA